MITVTIKDKKMVAGHETDGLFLYANDSKSFEESLQKLIADINTTGIA